MVIDEEEEESARARTASRTHQVVSRARCRLTHNRVEGESLLLLSCVDPRGQVQRRGQPTAEPSTHPPCAPIDGPYKAGEKHNPI